MEPVKKSAEELLKEANKLYGEKKYGEAVALFKSAAEENNAEALYMLGICYNYNYVDDEPDKDKRAVIASGYFQKAADLGHADAQCFSGLCYLHGIGVEKDENKAVELLKKSAGQNCAAAMNNLGLLCDRGIGADDPEKAEEEGFNWFKKSAESGDPTGQLYTGIAYYEGSGVKRDFEKAVKMYSLAAQQGLAEALFRLGECYDDGEGVDENSIEAFKLYKLAAQQNHAKAQCYVGYCYEYGTGVSRDLGEAIKWYTVSANNNYFRLIAISAVVTKRAGASRKI